MDRYAERLVIRYKITPAQAQSLVEAGHKTPKDIVRAKLVDLEAVEGVGPATVKKLRRHREAQ